MEQTPKGAARSDERGRPEVVVPCQVGVAGPEADPAHSVSEAPDRLWGADMEQTPKGAARSDERGRPELVVPCQVGVAGPEVARRKRRGPACSVRTRRVRCEAPDRLWGADMAPSLRPSRTRYRLALLAFAAVAMAGCVEPETSAKRSLRSILGSDAGDPGFAKANQIVDFSFPRDHGPHPRYRSEWWYLTAVVAATDGREFGVQFTLFRQGTEPRRREQRASTGAEAWRTGQVYMAHVAISDVAEHRHLESERFVRGHPRLAGTRAEPFGARLEDWQLTSTGKRFWPLRLTAATADFAVDLELTQTRPIILQGESGLSRKGPGNASYYYSVPRIEARGKLALGDGVHALTGTAWLDREWSTSVLSDAHEGWDWFAFHLDDGRDLMLYRLRRVDGRRDAYNGGSLRSGDTIETLTAGDFSLTPIEHWRGWPVAWRLTLGDGEPERFVVRAAFEDQVMDTSVRYWEGVAYLEDEKGRRTGTGYMELTGY